MHGTYSMVTGIAFTRTVYHPENGEDYTFHISIGIAASLKNEEVAGAVSIYCWRGAQYALMGKYQTDPMNAYSALTITEVRVKGLQNWLTGTSDKQLIRMAQYAIREQSGPVVMINKRGELDGPLLHELMEADNEIK